MQLSCREVYKYEQLWSNHYWLQCPSLKIQHRCFPVCWILCTHLMFFFFKKCLEWVPSHIGMWPLWVAVDSVIHIFKSAHLWLAWVVCNFWRHFIPLHAHQTATRNVLKHTDHVDFSVVNVTPKMLKTHYTRKLYSSRCMWTISPEVQLTTWLRNPPQLFSRERFLSPSDLITSPKKLFSFWSSCSCKWLHYYLLLYHMIYLWKRVPPPPLSATLWQASLMHLPQGRPTCLVCAD